ncbi:MAG: putative phosphothreonine lyase domain-containing protein [Chloroflexota bacterium]
MNDKPNLDLIAMVQKARMEHDAQAKPSQVSAVYWIESKRQTEGDGAAPTPRAGHWLIRLNVVAVDAGWETIRQATEAGRLGYKSKVATIALHQRDERSVYVMTYDADDAPDVERVRVALHDLGFDDNLIYERGD